MFAFILIIYLAMDIIQADQNLLAQHLHNGNRQTLAVKLLDQIEQIRAERRKHHADICTAK